VKQPTLGIGVGGKIILKWIFLKEGAGCGLSTSAAGQIKNLSFGNKYF
jgi:hypothetical protein